MAKTNLLVFWCLAEWRKFLLVWLWLCFPTVQYLDAQNLEQYFDEDQYVYTQWDNTNGLPQNTIFDIIRDETGYLWIATEEGLVRFDGTKFSLISRENHPDLHSNYFTDLTLSASGGIWASSRNTILRIENNSTTAYDLRDHLEGSVITAVSDNHDGNLWAGTSSGDLFLLSDGEISESEEWNNSLQGEIQQLKRIPDGMLIGTSEGLFRYSENTKRIKSMPGLKSVNVRALEVENNGTIWAGTEKEGLLQFRQGELNQFSEEDGLPEPFITSLKLDSDGRLWTGTSSSGLFVFENEKFKEAGRREALGHDVKSIFISRQNVIWIGTSGSGLIRMELPDIYKLSGKLEFSDNIILPVYQHINDDVWFGTAGQGIFRIQGDHITKFTRADGLANEIVLSVFGTEQAIYVGTAAGLDRFNLQENRFDKRYTQSDGLASNIVQSVYVDSEKNVWVATRSGGIHIIHDEQIETINLSEKVSAAGFISFLEDSDGNIWVGSDGAGMVRISKDRMVKHFTISEGLPSDLVHSFFQDSDGSLWIGTAEGLVYMEDNEFYVLDNSSGLKNEEVYTIIDDEHGYVWLSSNFGLQRISIDQLTAFKTDKNPDFQISVRTFNSSDGMANSEANGGIFPAGWKMNDGTLWFPTVEGAAVVKPSVIDEFQDPVDVIIQSIRFGNEEHSPDKHISVPPGVYNIQIEYTSIEFSKPDAINFSYRLKELDDKWEKVSNRRTAYFTSLLPGTYTFEVKAEQYGQISEAAFMTFEVIPFFYQTVWFRSGILLVLFLAGFLVKQLHSKSAEENKLKSLVKERTRELENALSEKNALIMEVHHRVKNNLAVISSFMNLQTFSTENEEMKNILYNFQSRVKSIASIHEVLYQLESFSELNFKKVVEKMLIDIPSIFITNKHIKQEVELEPVNININQAIPAALFFNEVVSNIYKHAFTNRESGLVSISLQEKDNRIKLIIKDDGCVGLPADAFSKKSETLGFKLIHTLVQQLKGKLNIETNIGNRYILEFEKSNATGSASNLI